VLKPGK